MCVCTHTHTLSLEGGEGKGESACIWLGDREAEKKGIALFQTERESNILCTFAFRILHFGFSPSLCWWLLCSTATTVLVQCAEGSSFKGEQPLSAF